MGNWSLERVCNLPRVPERRWDLGPEEPEFESCFTTLCKLPSSLCLSSFTGQQEDNWGTPWGGCTLAFLPRTFHSPPFSILFSFPGGFFLHIMSAASGPSGVHGFADGTPRRVGGGRGAKTGAFTRSGRGSWEKSLPFSTQPFPQDHWPFQVPVATPFSHLFKLRWQQLGCDSHCVISHSWMVNVYLPLWQVIPVYMYCFLFWLWLIQYACNRA